MEYSKDYSAFIQQFNISEAYDDLMVLYRDCDENEVPQKIHALSRHQQQRLKMAIRLPLFVLTAIDLLLKKDKIVTPESVLTKLVEGEEKFDIPIEVHSKILAQIFPTLLLDKRLIVKTKHSYDITTAGYKHLFAGHMSRTVVSTISTQLENLGELDNLL